MAGPVALSYVYTDQTWLNSLLSADGVNLRLDDDSSGTVDPTELANLTYQGMNVSSAKVNGFCQPRYRPIDLNKSFEVWDWTTVLTAHWLAMRRGNPVPDPLQGLYEETLDYLKEVKTGDRLLAGIAPRNAEWIAWSNVQLDKRYVEKQLRVQRPLSERDDRRYVQIISRWSEWINYGDDF